MLCFFLMVRQVGMGQAAAAPPLYPPTTTNLVMHRVALAQISIWPLSNNTPVSTDQLYVSPGMWSWKERNDDFSLTEDGWLHYIGQILWEMVAFLYFMHSLEKTSAPIGALVM